MRKNKLHKMSDGLCIYCKLTTSEILKLDDPSNCGIEDRRLMVQTEQDLQVRAEIYALSTGWVKPGSQMALQRQNVKGIFYRIPNQAFASQRSGGILGLWLKNLPDLMFDHPDGRYLHFEFKSRGGKSTKGQKSLRRFMNIIEERTFDGYVNKLEAWYTDKSGGTR